MYNPPVEANSDFADKYRLTGWGKKRSQGNTFDIELPSGQTCLAKKLEVADVMRMGLLSRLDTFTGAVMQPKGGKKSKKQDANVEFLRKLSDPEKFNDLEELLDKIVVESVVIPQVLPLPEEGQVRLDAEALGDTKIYVDEVDFFDKLKIFESVMDGMSDLSDFRSSEGSDMGTVADGQEVPGSTE